MFKITARVLPLPTIIDYSRYHADSVIPGFGRRLMTLAERDAKYPVLAGVDPGGDVELDLDDRRARQALEDQAAALIDPVPVQALMRGAASVDVEKIDVVVDFDGCAIPPPPKGYSVREAVDHYVASTPAGSLGLTDERPDHVAAWSLRSTLQLSQWRDYKPKWQSLSRGGQTRRERSDGTLEIHVQRGGSEPVAGWYARCLRATWGSFALHQFVDDLDAGRLVLNGLEVAGRSNRASPILRQWWRTRGVAIDLNAGSAGLYERYKVVADWVELVVARGNRQPASAGNVTSALKSARGRSPAPYWDEAKREGRRWLRENGYPVAGDGRQAELERAIADWLSARGHPAAEPSIRRHVAKWIAEYRAELGAGS